MYGDFLFKTPTNNLAQALASEPGPPIFFYHYTHQVLNLVLVLYFVIHLVVYIVIHLVLYFVIGLFLYFIPVLFLFCHFS